MKFQSIIWVELLDNCLLCARGRKRWTERGAAVTVDRRVRRTSRDVDEAERRPSRRLDSVSNSV